MDYREESFRRKFSSAAQHLNVSSDRVVSMKFRENVGSYDEYRELLDTLQHEAGIHYSEVDGDLQGRGYLVGFGTSKLLLVEHETGLEILYIAGSIASLFSLVPMILQGWAAIRGRFPRRGRLINQPVEIRRIDQAGRLHEEHLHDHQLSAPSLPMGTLAPAFTIAAMIIESDTKNLVRQVEELTRRIDAIEKKALREQVATEPKQTKPKKSISKKTKKAKAGRVPHP
ncbi:MAG TPA: hypothetical protein VMW15_01560 [Terracidiphilus sp.]|nr:hypothetical protein [Terracidiphilus sp.]